MNLYGCYAGDGCMGCSHCEEKDLEYYRAEDQARTEAKLRAANLPTLHVKLGEFFKVKK